METLGFQRALDYLLQAGVRVDVVTTDRSPSIKKLMREKYSDIQHQFDPWHVAKGKRSALQFVYIGTSSTPSSQQSFSL